MKDHLLTRQRLFPSMIKSAPARLLLALFLIVIAGPVWHQAASAQQTQQSDIQRFVRFLGSKTYSELLGNKALDVDEKLPPRCKSRKLVRRKLFAVSQRPQFIRSREVPIAGRWAERVTVQRCGRLIEHNIFVEASRVRGLVAIAGFPGRSLTGLDLQGQAGRQVLRAARQRHRSCRRLEIVNMQVASRPATRGARWREIWTVYACGRRDRQGLTFTPGANGVRVTLD